MSARGADERILNVHCNAHYYVAEAQSAKAGTVVGAVVGGVLAFLIVVLIIVALCVCFRSVTIQYRQYSTTLLFTWGESFGTSEHRAPGLRLICSHSHACTNLHIHALTHTHLHTHTLTHTHTRTHTHTCLLYTSPSPRDWSASRMPSSA